ncbi:MAG: TIGR03960 family B12-binding radical SAM protein [Candidatus Omnitrophota bacterium]|nr:TIGR03960 family B12-binding radical SAM protein [Candidatus Omnitrophota bacterium]
MIEDFLLQVNKPGRYIGGEWNVSGNDFSKAETKFALCFPDLYEVGMSNLGLRILYGILNNAPGVCAERFFSCAEDLEKVLRAGSMEIFSLESGKPLREFDLAGFSLGSELNYTNVLAMLDLGGLPLKAAERDSRHPLIIGGGPCALNPEPMHEFFDLFFIGEAEDAILELIYAWRRMKQEYISGKISKTDLLIELTRIEGVYAPSLYEVTYDDKGKIERFAPKSQAVNAVVKKRVVASLDTSFFPTEWLVPFIQIIHDRISIEIMRGCPNRCRFCQARSQYFPYRIRSVENVLGLADKAYSSTGYDEISLCGLSVSDYPGIHSLLQRLLAKFKEKAVSISLPSIKARALTGELAELIATIKKTGLTFAPEAGTEKLRRILAKDFNEEEFFQALTQAYQSGYQHVKLYFMLGLPFEELADLDGIIEFSTRVSQLRRKLNNSPAQVNLSVNAFIPKPHTPLVFCRMQGIEEIKERQAHLKARIKNRRIKASFHDPYMSFVEGILSRGDRRLSSVILNVYLKGARFDAWGNYFSFQKWQDAFNEEKIDPDFYLRPRPPEEILPWDHIDTGVSRKALEEEFNLAQDVKK